ncbi:TetR/AcrR family transcriptional regulator [Nocardiopsis ganjiahuensis]|uniref:TetR/AcrR family transcriptional regulator n=1 Tax=Nocardiopsis ganjiahuensis TaxID=239984 RepID=UPI0003464E01|nr:TetR/AcrR family transcriptional regulator [Nocardiopsis ganjiahuensis]
MNKGRGGRRPDPAVDEAVRRAAVELLLERGFELTFDEVAERAGVGRTSVFRRYATKQELVLAAAEQVTIGRIEVPDTGTLRGDMGAAVLAVYGVFGEAATQTLARHALVAALQDQAGSVIMRAVLDRRLEMVTALLERAVDRGEITGTDRARLVADLLSGVIMARMASGQPLPEKEEAEALAAAMATAAGAA